MTTLETLALVLALCALLSFISYRLHLLTASGSIASFLMGVVIGSFGSVSWLIILIAFALSGFLVTKFKFELKRRKGVQEGKKGERTWKNVVANGLVPALIAVVAWALGQQDSPAAGLIYLTAVSVAASDTIASELGVLSNRTFLITSMKKVAVGTNGGVSAYGTAWALVGATVASLLGWLLLFPWGTIDERILIPIVMGFLGCNIDSLIGATLERRGITSKLSTNLLSMAFGALGSLLIILLFYH
jgi:uncharacterized protein (TIGR00297 family)